jgi:signal transduction histidine kinase
MLDVLAFRQAILDQQPVAKTEIELSGNLKQGYRAQLTVPIRAKGEVYGGLVLFYTNPHSFSSEDIEVAITVGEQIALVIENARLRTQVEHAAVAAERNRLARDLHDSVTQTLFSASLIAEVLPRLWERNPEEGRRRLAELRESTRGALAEMRTLLLELRPATLTEVDLNDLLRLLAEAITARARIPVTLRIDGEHEIPPDVKLATYRVAQEALNNVAKHARAHHASVTLNRLSTSIELMIVDDGCGFTFEKIAPDHLGLSIMRERADSIGAVLTIQNQPDQGTVVTFHWYAGNRHLSAAAS